MRKLRHRGLNRLPRVAQLVSVWTEIQPRQFSSTIPPLYVCIERGNKKHILEVLNQNNFCCYEFMI